MATDNKNTLQSNITNAIRGAADAAKSGTLPKPDAPATNDPNRPATKADVGAAVAKWAWSDDFDTGVAPPAAPERAPRSTELPFKALFPKMLPAAITGEKPSKAVPMAFFLERSTKPATFTPAKAQGKIKDQYNTWLKEQTQAVQDSLTIAFAQKSGKEDDARIKEPHIVFWLLTATPKAPAAGATTGA
jgi:hypothetical protein